MIISTGWGGLDTLVVAAGVSALQPLLAVAGADRKGTDLTPMQTTAEGIQKASDVASLAIKGNYIGPLVGAVTFVRVFSLSLLSFLSTDNSIVIHDSLPYTHEYTDPPPLINLPLPLDPPN
jgi:hypothetical protein